MKNIIITSDNDLKSIFVKPAIVQNGDTISINYNNISIQHVGVKNVAPGNSNQIYVIELDNGYCLQKYNCPNKNKDVVIIFSDSLPAPNTTIIYSV